ncbi:MAG: KOW motif-containing protein [Bacteroidales bacterium]|nr:KOW motif-containing protein [Candidatus Minthousia equi]
MAPTNREEYLSTNCNTQEKWFYMRAYYGNGKKISEILNEKGIRNFFPVQVKKIYNNNRLKFEYSYPLPSNIFIRCTEYQAWKLVTSSHTPESIDHLAFAYDHTYNHTDGKNPLMTIPDSMMQQFIQAASIEHNGVYYISDEELHKAEASQASQELKLKFGDTVRVTDGPFADIVGKVLKVYGKKRVVVSIPNIVNFATASINLDYLQPVEDL